MICLKSVRCVKELRGLTGVFVKGNVTALKSCDFHSQLLLLEKFLLAFTTPGVHPAVVTQNNLLSSPSASLSQHGGPGRAGKERGCTPHPMPRCEDPRGFERGAAGGSE